MPEINKWADVSLDNYRVSDTLYQVNMNINLENMMNFWEKLIKVFLLHIWINNIKHSLIYFSN